MPNSDGTQILIIEDNPTVVDVTTHLLQRKGWTQVAAAATGREALEWVARQSFGVILLDLGLPDLSGEIVFDGIKERRPEIPIVIVTAKNDIDTAVRFMSEGAFDYVLKGSEPIRLTSAVDRAFQYYRKSTDLSALQESLLSSGLKNPEAFASIITENDRLKSILRMAEAVSASDEAVLISGETGVGKELLSRAIHDCSGRQGRFVALNVGGLEDPIFDDTLFGHTRVGAFTGADQSRKGLAAAAEGGTLFLDEVGDLKPQSQVKLLRFLESREYFPLGSDSPRQSSARLIAATNSDLNVLVERGSFRKDLLYRISTFHLVIPPLRERQDDILLVGNHILRTLDRDHGKNIRLTSGAVNLLQSLPLPGNVRELRQILLRARMASTNGEIDCQILESLGFGSAMPAQSNAGNILFPETLPTVHDAVEALIQEALRRSHGKQNAAAALIGLSPQAISKRIRNKKVD